MNAKRQPNPKEVKIASNKLNARCSAILTSAAWDVKRLKAEAFANTSDEISDCVDELDQSLRFINKMFVAYANPTNCDTALDESQEAFKESTRCLENVADSLGMINYDIDDDLRL